MIVIAEDRFGCILYGILPCGGSAKPGRRGECLENLQWDAQRIPQLGDSALQPFHCWHATSRNLRTDDAEIDRWVGLVKRGFGVGKMGFFSRFWQCSCSCRDVIWLWYHVPVEG